MLGLNRPAPKKEEVLWRSGGRAEVSGGWRAVVWRFRWVQRRMTVVGATYRRQWPVVEVVGGGAGIGGDGGARAELG